MKYWLIKSEPFKYGWNALLKDKTTCWDGIRNYAARNILMQMEVGDNLFFYHSNEGKEIVGIAEVTRTYYQDPTTDVDAWVVVDVKPIRSLKQAVPLTTIKKVEKLSQMVLLKNSRLSVQPVLKKEWDLIVALSEGKPVV